MTLIEVLAVWGIQLNERQAQQLLEEMMGADVPTVWFLPSQDNVSGITWEVTDDE